MKKSNLALLSIGLFGMLASCASPQTYELKDYTTGLVYKDNFLICQLSDLHFSTASNLEKDFKYITNVVKSYGKYVRDENILPDLLILNGDNFMNANRSVVSKTFNFFDSLKIPYAYTYGNHDYQGSYGANYINDLLINHAKTGYSVYKNPVNDNVYGNCNYVLNLHKNNKTKFQIYLLDSNSYVLGAYDNIHQDQVDWYENAILETNGLTKGSLINEDEMIKSLAFFHIPTKEFIRASEDFNSRADGSIQSLGDEYSMIKTKPATEGSESNIMKVMHKYKSTVGVGVAHDHYNSSDLWSSDGTDWPIRLIYGNKTGDNGMCDADNMGATFYTIHETPKISSNGNKLYFSLTKLLVNYEGEVSCQWKNV